MSSLFFWIIILSILIPFLMRWHRRSTQGRSQRFFDGPGTFGGPGAPDQSNQPRDGFTQQDYFSGPYRQIQPPRQDLPPVLPTWQDAPSAEQVPPRQAAAPEPEPQETRPPVTPPPADASGPKGYRARKLAELDAKFSAGELSMEDYMAQRDEIMRG